MKNLHWHSISSSYKLVCKLATTGFILQSFMLDSVPLHIRLLKERSLTNFKKSPSVANCALKLEVATAVASFKPAKPNSRQATDPILATDEALESCKKILVVRLLRVFMNFKMPRLTMFPLREENAVDAGFSKA